VVGNHRLENQNPHSGFNMISRRILFDGESTKMNTELSIAGGELFGDGFAGG
jgi:hypothetical protein